MYLQNLEYKDVHLKKVMWVGTIRYHLYRMLSEDHQNLVLAAARYLDMVQKNSLHLVHYGFRYWGLICQIKRIDTCGLFFHIFQLVVPTPWPYLWTDLYQILQTYRYAQALTFPNFLFVSLIICGNCMGWFSDFCTGLAIPNSTRSLKYLHW